MRPRCTTPWPQRRALLSLLPCLPPPPATAK
nr:MAG TPA: hypothetical protein [Caudoviricetes sp.]